MYILYNYININVCDCMHVLVVLIVGSHQDGRKDQEVPNMVGGWLQCV